MGPVRHHGFIQRLALIGVLAVFAGVAHASTITYDLEGGTTTGGGTVTGTVTIDSGTDLVTAGDLAFDGSTYGDYVFDNFEYSGSSGLPGENWSELESVNYTVLLYLYYDTANIGAGDLGVDFVEVDMAGTYFDNFSGATLDPETAAVSPAPTPEPSSLLLLGTGVLGLVGARRRFVTA
jgi:hypothetical protein